MSAAPLDLRALEDLRGPAAQAIEPLWPVRALDPRVQALFDGYNALLAEVRRLTPRAGDVTRANPPVDWLAHADSFAFEYERERFTIETRVGRQGTRWAVALHGSVLDIDLIEFVYEPNGSSRSDEFLAATRFPTREAAHAALQRYLETHERRFGGWERRADAPPLPPDEDDEDDDGESPCEGTGGVFGAWQPEQEMPPGEGWTG